MGWADFNDYGAEEDPEYRRNAVEKRLLAPLGLSFTTKDIIGAVPEDAAAEERRALERKEQVAKEDRMFGNYWGASLGAKVMAGDPEGRDD